MCSRSTSSGCRSSAIERFAKRALMSARTASSWSPVGCSAACKTPSGSIGRPPCSCERRASRRSTHSLGGSPVVTPSARRRRACAVTPRRPSSASSLSWYITLSSTAELVRMASETRSKRAGSAPLSPCVSTSTSETHGVPGSGRRPAPVSVCSHAPAVPRPKSSCCTPNAPSARPVVVQRARSQREYMLSHELLPSRGAPTIDSVHTGGGSRERTRSARSFSASVWFDDSIETSGRTAPRRASSGALAAARPFRARARRAPVACGASR
mmetsp:Transcript_40816/g.95304  ORF Transcript_40816/g.95304 Transcript_40816/m.95304 type:complete len:269 (+) Transcript_40816:691-1497(+)